MWKNKFVFWLFQADQGHALASYLEQQASEGWGIDPRKISPRLPLNLKRQPPVNRKYSAVYFPNASQWDRENDETFSGYRDLCEDCGWTYEGGHAGFKLFSNTDMDALPVETDPEMQFETVRQQLLYKSFPYQWVLLGILAVFIIFNLRNFESLVMSNYRLVMLVYTSAVALGLAGYLGMQYRSYFKLKKSVAAGRWLREVTMKEVKGRTIYLYVLAVPFILLNQSFIGGKFNIASLAVTVVFDVALIVIMSFLYSINARRKLDTDEDYTRSYSIFGLIIVVLSVGVLTNVQKVFFPPKEEEHDQISDLNFPIDLSNYGLSVRSDYHIWFEKSVMAEHRGAYYGQNAINETGMELSVDYYQSGFNWVIRNLMPAMNEDKGNAYECSGPLTSMIGDVEISAYVYSINHQEFENAPDYYTYVLKRGGEILKLEFANEENYDIVKAAAAGMQNN